MEKKTDLQAHIEALDALYGFTPSDPAEKWINTNEPVTYLKTKNGDTIRITGYLGQSSQDGTIRYDHITQDTIWIPHDAKIAAAAFPIPEDEKKKHESKGWDNYFELSLIEQAKQENSDK